VLQAGLLDDHNVECSEKQCAIKQASWWSDSCREADMLGDRALDLKGLF